MTVLVNGVPDSRKVAGQPLTSDVFPIDVPIPDVWIPFTDNLRMITGYGENILSGTEVVATKATFSRASTGTYIDKSGVLRTAAINEPRFEKEGLLIEGQSTNLVVNSLFTSDWSQVRSVVEQKATTSPDGTNNAVKLRCDSSANNSHRTGPSIIYTSGVIYTASVFAKAAELNQVAFRFFDTTFGSSASVVFNLEGDGSFSGPDGYNPTIRRLPNGWYRIEASKTATVTFTGGITIDLIKNGLMSFDGDGVSGVYLYGGQVEALPFASSYIPTNGTAATRAADLCYLPYPQNWLTESYTVACEFDCKGLQSTRAATFGKTVNREQWAGINDNGRVRATIDTGYTVIGPAVTFGSGHVQAFREKNNTATVSLDGVLSSASAPSKSVGNGTHIGIGGLDNTGTNVLNGHIKSFRIWHRALTDAQIISLQ